MNKLTQVLQLCIFAALLSVLQVANATIMLGGSGLAAADSIVTFDEIVLVPGATVTNQYDSLGLTFSSGVVYDANGSASFPGFSGHHVGNFFPVTNPWSLYFANDVSEAAFAMASNPNNSFVTALLNGSVVESVQLFTTYNNSGTAFIQFSGILFDEIQLSTSGDGLSVIDNVQFSSKAVPEPGSLMLLAVGMLGLAFIRRQRV